MLFLYTKVVFYKPLALALEMIYIIRDKIRDSILFIILCTTCSTENIRRIKIYLYTRSRIYIYTCTCTLHRMYSI